MKFKIGIDGGGTKTECILIDEEATVVAMHVGTGCNPSIVGADQARSIVSAALESLRAQAATHSLSLQQPAAPATRSAAPKPDIVSTLLCMAGSRSFWQEFAAGLQGFGKVVATDDSRPVLELATHGRPGLVLHAGTGSFVAARAPDGAVHYAGGLGWRLGDPASGYDIGRRATARALLDLQGWAPASPLSALLRQHTGLTDGAAISRSLNEDPKALDKIASMTPGVLRLANEGDQTSIELIVQSARELLDLATRVGEKLFSSSLLGTIPTGLSGPILTHPVVRQALASRSTMALSPVEGTPIEGVRRLLLAVD